MLTLKLLQLTPSSYSKETVINAESKKTKIKIAKNEY